MSSATSTFPETLFPMPAPIAKGKDKFCPLERAREFHTRALEIGGMIPRSAAATVLGLHRSRIGKLCDTEVLETCDFYGVQFVTNRSISAYLATRGKSIGRGHKRLPFLDQCRVGISSGWEMSKALTK